MKKLALTLAAAALVLSLSSCASKEAEEEELEAPEGLELFAEEDDGLLHLDYDYVGTADGTSCTNLPAKASLIVKKDYSKAKPVDLFCDDPELVKFAGETAVKIPANGDGNIRVIWLFDEPIDAASVSEFSFSIGGLDIPYDNTWTANIALMYNNDITSGEHATAMYPVAAAIDGYLTRTYDLNSEEGKEGLWGNGYKPEGKFMGIQIYYGGRDPIFIKDLSLK